MRAFLAVSVTALIIGVGMTVTMVLKLRNIMIQSSVDVGEAAAHMSADSIESLALNDATNLVAAKTKNINQSFNETVEILNIFKSYVESLYNNPNDYKPAFIPSFKEIDEGALSIHWFVQTGRLKDEEYNENGLLRLGLQNETYLLGNMKPLFEAMMKQRDDINSIYIQTETGMNVQYDTAAYKKAQVPEIPDMQTREWYVAARDTEALYISDTYPDSAGRGLCITISLPIYNNSNEFVAVIGCDFLISKLSETVNEMVFVERGYAMLLGEDRVIASPGLTEGNEYELPIFWDKLSIRNDGIVPSEIDGENVYIVWNTVPLTGWKLVCVLPVTHIIASAELTKNKIVSISHDLIKVADEGILLSITLLLGLLVIIMAVIVVLSRKVANKISEPILSLSVGAERISSGDLDYTFSVKTGDEIDELANIFNSMLANVKMITADKERVERESEAKALETKIIRKAHENLLIILDRMPLGIVVLSKDDFTVLYHNKSILRVLGFPIDDSRRKASDNGSDLSGDGFEYNQFLGKSVFDFLPETQPDGRNSVQAVIEFYESGDNTRDIQCRKLSGELFLARINALSTNYNGISSTFAVIEDMTEEEEHKKMLQNTALREQEANQLKSRFVANISHEIRTPINAILGTAELELQNDSISLQTEEALIQIYESGNLLLNIINDILDLSKIEADKLELVPVPYNVPSLINDIVQINRLRYESKPINFYLDMDKDLPLKLCGDELRIKQILNNILSNAFKYTDNGDVMMSVLVEEKNENDTVTLIFRVSDTGQGMTEEQIGKIYEEYTRFNLEINRTTAGTGLGMSITKRLVDLMDGEMLIESEVGKGSVFTVRLPQKLVDSLKCGDELVEKLNSFHYQSSTVLQKGKILRDNMPEGSVLVVDDVASNLYVTKGMLVLYGLKVDTVSSGFEAIDKIKNGNVYDIIFMDHMMPRMDGIEATKIIRSMGYTKAIVALTANALVGQADRFLNNGFDGYLSKPLDSRELNMILNEFIRNQ